MDEEDRCCDEDYGGSHYHCAACNEVTGMTGHYKGNGVFSCQLKKCAVCNGFGYTKGGPRGPWEKLDCEACKGKGKVL